MRETHLPSAAFVAIILSVLVLPVQGFHAASVLPGFGLNREHWGISLLLRPSQHLGGGLGQGRKAQLCMAEGPDPLSSLQDLEEDLENAVQAEDYQKAAEIRDKLNGLKQDTYISVLQANSEFYRAFREQSVPAMKTIWHDPGEDSDQKIVVCAHPGMPPIVGRDEVLQSWSAILREGSPSINPENVQISIVGDVAWVTCEEKFAAEPGMGPPPFSCLATNIFVRGASGWKMTHHHAGPVQGRIGLVGD